MEKKITWEARSLDDLRTLAVDFLELQNTPVVVCLHAEMGVGKTTFVQYILQAMGIEDPEGSPTYSIVNEYVSPKYGKVFHLDLYRTDTEEELYDIGLEEIIYGNHYAFIEWPSRAESMLPDDCVNIRMTLQADGSRLIVVEFDEEESEENTK